MKSDVANKQASIVTISMNNSVPRRAEDVINTLIAVYEEDAIADKRQVSVVTNAFIKERMLAIGRELGVVDSEIEGIKKSNQMIDITSEATRSITESSKFKVEGLSIENQISVANYIRDYLDDPSHAGDLIPMVASLTNNGIVAQITEYNDAILRRQKLLENSSERNPVIQDMDNVLAAVRRSIIASLNSHVSTLEIQLSNMRKEEALANHRISTMPSQEKVLLDIMRQQKIKEELFLYLLNKQEETQLNYAVAESNSRTIDQAYGSPRPVSPRSMIILGISLLAGLAIPVGIIYLIGMLDTTIRGRKDIEENISAPFLGDIPFLEGENKGGIVVRETGRDALSEAFRILRSNMTFMNVSSGKEIKCVLFTSSDPHAGKTFVAMNLAMTLAMAGKRVVLIDLDLRRHALTTHGTQQQQERHVRLSGRNDHRHRPAGDEHGLPREPRRDLRRHTAAQPHRDAALEPARQAGRAVEGALRLRIHRQHAGHVGSRCGDYGPSGRPLYLYRARRRARPPAAARHRTALPREEIPQHVRRTQRHAHPPPRIRLRLWVRIWLRVRIRVWLRRLQGDQLPQAPETFLQQNRT
ncbi:MAG: GumC family protein [Alistipes sp.]